MIGTFLAGLVYGIVALIISKAGYRWIMNLLAANCGWTGDHCYWLAHRPTAVKMAMNRSCREV